MLKENRAKMLTVKNVVILAILAVGVVAALAAIFDPDVVAGWIGWAGTEAVK